MHHLSRALATARTEDLHREAAQMHAIRLARRVTHEPRRPRSRDPETAACISSPRVGCSRMMGRTFLDALSEEEATDLHAAGRRCSYGAAVTIVHEGDDAGPVVVLLEGRAKVTTSAAVGREAIIAVRGPGDLIGELSAIDNSPRSASVTTLEPVEALLLPGSGFAALLESRPRIALVILRTVAGRLRDADTSQAQLGTHDVVARVSQRVIELADRFGEEDDGRIDIALPLSQEELAAWAGASREAVSKALQQLRSLGIVETGRRHLTVLDPDALRSRAAL